MAIKLQLIVLCVLVTRIKSYVFKSQDFESHFLKPEPNTNLLGYVNVDHGSLEVTTDNVHKTQDLSVKGSLMEYNLEPFGEIRAHRGSEQVLTPEPSAVTPVDEPDMAKQTIYKVASIINGGRKCPTGYYRKNGICIKLDLDYDFITTSNSTGDKS